MAIEKVKQYFETKGIADRILEFDVSSATVDLAAQAVGVEGARIAKTLSFKLKDDSVILIVCAGDTKIDNKKYKAKFGCKAAMLKFDEVEPAIGHAVGGVCPFAINPDVKVYLDNSMKRFETVYPAAGSDNSAVEMTMEDLEHYANNVQGWVDVCKGWA